MGAASSGGTNPKAPLAPRMDIYAVRHGRIGG